MRITERIRYVGVNDRKEHLFENQWPLPFGVAYNSYLVVDEKIALIDTVAEDFAEEYLGKIRAEIGERPIDYLIVNHMEPDHSALMSIVRKEWPEIRIVTNAKAVPMIEGYHGITDNILTIKEGETLSLGGSTLVFRMTPMVHWPETMMTWLEEEKTLFSGDAFGCFGVVDGRLADRFSEFEDEMIRYYSNIVGKYGQTVQAAFKKLAGVDIRRICSTHGPIWEAEIPQVIDLYDRMSRYETRRGVCLAYCSMYGNTEMAAKALEKELIARNVEYAMHDLSKENPSFAYRDVFKYDTLVIGAPTYNNGIFPPADMFMQGVCARLVKNHRFAAFGSFTWLGASVKLLNEMAGSHGFDVLTEGFPFNQGFTAEKFDAAAFADLLA